VLRRHRVLIIGVGSIGQRHVRCFQATGRAEVAIVEIAPDLRRRVAGQYGVTAAHGDLDAALADPPDVAVVATPAPSHVPLAIQLARAGVHVLVEKPLSTSMEGIGELRAVVKNQKVVAGVAYIYRAHPLLGAMRAAVLGGRFGRPVEVVAAGGQHFPTYRPEYRTIYYNDRATGGGAIQDALTHVINAAEWLVGPVDRLVADAAHRVLEGVTVEDTAHILARHGHVLASYSLNQYQAPNEITLTVVCERGTARCEFRSHRWRWMTTPGEVWHDEAIAPLERDALFVAQAGSFLDSVEGAGVPACSLDEGVQALRVNLAALASVDTRGWQIVERDDPCRS
jgi:predicted dehydrogenase